MITFDIYRTGNVVASEVVCEKDEISNVQILNKPYIPNLLFRLFLVFASRGGLPVGE